MPPPRSSFQFMVFLCLLLVLAQPSPPSPSQMLCSVDIDALVGVINSATKTVSIEVMDYVPIVMLVAKPRRAVCFSRNFRTCSAPLNIGPLSTMPSDKRFLALTLLPIFPSAYPLQAWARGVDVKLLIGNWSNSYPPMFSFLRSLAQVNDAITLAKKKGGRYQKKYNLHFLAIICLALRSQAFRPLFCSISIRLFNVPLDPSGYAPYTRVNHAKFMVSEQVLPPSLSLLVFCKSCQRTAAPSRRARS
jgi:hypothetical protein